MSDSCARYPPPFCGAGSRDPAEACRAGSPNPAKQAEPAPDSGRKHLRRLDRITVEGGPLYFLTCCVDDRKPVLACDVVASVLVEAWTTAPDVYGWAVGRYCVMPDHIHLFATPWREDPQSLSDFIKNWKRWTRRVVNQRHGPVFTWQAVFRSRAA
ncbi:MAG: transposase [Armatimonadota bacterium]